MLRFIISGYAIDAGRCKDLMDEEWVREERGVERSLPYGIKPVPVYYICVHCGRPVTLEELARMPSLMCPNCGQRIFIKDRAPPQTGFIRKVKAV